ncbi:MAG: CCC motif membrane protein [Bacteroidota bacterium]
MSEEQQPPQENTSEPVRPTTPPQNSGFNYGIQQALPNATAVLVLGILSIVTCCCYGVMGSILSIVALILSKKDRVLYAANMSQYTESSFKNLNAGRICAIVGLILSLLVVLFYIFIIIMFGWSVLSDQEALKEALQNMQG